MKNINKELDAHLKSMEALDELTDTEMVQFEANEILMDMIKYLSKDLNCDDKIRKIFRIYYELDKGTE